jgi:hypothetical protein
VQLNLAIWDAKGVEDRSTKTGEDGGKTTREAAIANALVNNFWVCKQNAAMDFSSSAKQESGKFDGRDWLPRTGL